MKESKISLLYVFKKIEKTPPLLYPEAGGERPSLLLEVGGKL